MPLMSRSAPKLHSSVKAASNFFAEVRLIRSFAGLGHFKSIAIGVSGGGDSMALLLMLHHHLRQDQSLTALTVDHQLRNSSAAEARKVKSWCKALGISHKSLNWKHAKITTGLQAKARAARYQLMVQHCAKDKIEALLTAHTLEDQAETVAMRKARTSSLKSLSAIWPETEINGLPILRPLLNFRRAELREFLLAHNQPWLEDPSNHDERFERVRLRNSGVSPALAKTATAAQKQMASANAKAKRWLAKHATQDASSMVQFSTQTFLALPTLAQDEALLLLIAMVGGKAPERAKRLSHLHWLQTPAEARRSLGGTIFARRKNLILLGREPARIASAPKQLSPTKPLIWDKRFMALGPRGSTVVAKPSLKTLKRIKNLPAFVDAGLPIIMAGEKLLATPFASYHPKAKLTLATK